MSDYAVKIIPKSPQMEIVDAALDSAVRCLESKLAAGGIEAHSYDTPAFIDCGSNLEEIRCPLCGEELSFDWWGEAMDTAAGDGFASLEATLPCCGERHSLNDLDYHFPCGFARWEIVVMNPAEGISPGCIAELETILDTPVRLIHAHI